MTFKIGRVVEAGVVRGVPLNVAGKRLVPIARTVSVTLRRSEALVAGFVWTRPIAVEVEDADGIQRVPIPDIGMRVTLSAMLVGVLVILAHIFRRDASSNHR
ncbi:MAG: hypothetical protein EPO21_11510 [Chloroflexota bacterium]|nr:MAG: hypothetical protein EPO21_11510 [Chloroflexota bacterium]